MDEGFYSSLSTHPHICKSSAVNQSGGSRWSKSKILRWLSFSSSSPKAFREPCLFLFALLRLQICSNQITVKIHISAPWLLILSRKILDYLFVLSIHPLSILFLFLCICIILLFDSIYCFYAFIFMFIFIHTFILIVVILI